MKYLDEIKNNIEVLRNRISSLIDDDYPKLNLISPEMIEISQKLDELILAYSRGFVLENLVDITYVFGKHSLFYYYGIHHLMINIHQYIKAGIENNEYICICMEDDLLSKLKLFLNKNGNLDSFINLYDTAILIKINKTLGQKALGNEVNNLTDFAHVNGFTGIRYIGQPSYIATITSKEDLMNFEHTIGGAIKGRKMSVLCIHDFNNVYLYKNVVGDMSIKDVQNQHEYILNSGAYK